MKKNVGKHINIAIYLELQFKTNLKFQSENINDKHF